MALRNTIPLLGSGGGLTPRNRRSGGGEAFANKSYFSPVVRALPSYAGHMSKRHRAGIPNRNLYMTVTTLGMHQADHPQWQKLNFVQNIELEEEMKQVLRQSPMVPTLLKEQYEEWKLNNTEEVKQHAGRYAIVEWDMETKSGGIVKSYSSRELLTTDPQLSSNRWIDYIQTGYGTTTRPNLLPEDPPNWNSEDYPSLDGTKEWVSFEDRESWTQAPQSTPVSKRISKSDKNSRLEREPIPRKDGIPKWLTFSSEFQYGTEQFSPWLRTHGHSSTDQNNNMEILHKTRQQHMGFAPRIVTDHYITVRPSRMKHKPFMFVKYVMKNRDIVTRSTPSGSEIWVKNGTQMDMRSYQVIANKSCKYTTMINKWKGCGYSVNHTSVEVEKYTKFRHPGAYFKKNLRKGF
eukprot:TRINITY_DN6945_c0_g1_i1.p1 TRINITY_DN6945_c0_g1~~TRINITY_DN6945_c0_g1_i1.p1  ORF type:complete len:429 (+),score=60.16 TRINITY_DN6945_c0_g1_i1:78-1289(+)